MSTPSTYFGQILASLALFLCACASPPPPRPIALDPANPQAASGPVLVVPPLSGEPPVNDSVVLPAPRDAPAPDEASAPSSPGPGHGDHQSSKSHPGGPQAGHDHGATPSKAAATFTCPMHPEIKAKEAGRCPKCGMKLVPVKAKESGEKR